MDSTPIGQMALKQTLLLQEQQGNINDRIKGLAYRLYKAKKSNISIPLKRTTANYLLNPTFRWVLDLRKKVRELRFVAWKNSANAEDFEQQIADDIQHLARLTSYYHFSMNNKLLRVSKKD